MIESLREGIEGSAVIVMADIIGPARGPVVRVSTGCRIGVNGCCFFSWVLSHICVLCILYVSGFAFLSIFFGLDSLGMHFKFRITVSFGSHE